MNAVYSYLLGNLQLCLHKIRLCLFRGYLLCIFTRLKAYVLSQYFNYLTEFRMNRFSS